MKKGVLIEGGFLLLLGGAVLAAQLRPDLLHAWVGLAFPWPYLIAGLGCLAMAYSIYIGSFSAVLVAASIISAASIEAYRSISGVSFELGYLWPLVPALIGLVMFTSGSRGGGKPNRRKDGLYLMGISLLALVVFYAMTAANLNMALTWSFLLILAGVYRLATAAAYQ